MNPTPSIIIIVMLTAALLLPTTLAYVTATANSDATWEDRTLVEKYGVTVGSIATAPFFIAFLIFGATMPDSFMAFGILVAALFAWAFWSTLIYWFWRITSSQLVKSKRNVQSNDA